MLLTEIIRRKLEDHDSIKKIEGLGAICIKTGTVRGSYSVFEAIKYIVGYINILRKYSIDIAINFTKKLFKFFCEPDSLFLFSLIK